jgi:hypothetical protein
MQMKLEDQAKIYFIASLISMQAAGLSHDASRFVFWMYVVFAPICLVVSFLLCITVVLCARGRILSLAKKVEQAWLPAWALSVAVFTISFGVNWYSMIKYGMQGWYIYLFYSVGYVILLSAFLLPLWIQPTQGQASRSKGRGGDFDHVVEGLKAELKRSLVDGSAYDDLQKDQWLRTLYESYCKRFMEDNSRIWTTGSIMIPLSLAAFAAVPNMTNARLLHLAVLAAASISLMLAWLVISENHRAFQEKSRAWIVAIELTLGLEKTGESKIKGDALNSLLIRPHAAQAMRWLLLIFVVVGWVLVIVFRH